jgi:glycosyltransferase involved in cell wall biosynthesis
MCVNSVNTELRIYLLGSIVEMVKKINVASDVSIMSGLNYATGVQRLLVETHQHLYEFFKDSKFDIRGLNLSEGTLFKQDLYLSQDPLLQPPYFAFKDLEIVLAFDGNNGYIIRELISNPNPPILVSLAHDILPITNPEYFNGSPLNFKAYFLRMLAYSDYIICTSNATLQSILSLGWKTNAKFLIFPLGAFEIAPLDIQQKNSTLNLLAINTIEPRKGYEDILNAFDSLISKGFDIELNIVGRYGWNSLEVKNRLETHRLFGKRLFWHKGISDAEVTELYKKTDICLVASEAEGFGLTLEEGLARGRKVIARNIDVFKERPNDNLFFFEGGGAELATKILEVSKIPWTLNGISQIRTMEDFARDVADLICDIADQPHKRLLT